ncbi:MAG: mechanosensitive ion channel family protein [Acidobacteria bacterium]|nr:MAG: mechanosensitive ion channel family protein [Acidobacteriota bacterium]
MTRLANQRIALSLAIIQLRSTPFMPILSTNIFSEPIWRHVLSEWHQDLAERLRHDLPRILVILIVAVAFSRLLKLFTRKLQDFSRREALPSGIRATQLRTLASIAQSVGNFLIFFFVLLQILPIFNIDVKPFLASAGIVGLAVGFGAQTLVKDVINGFFIIIDNIYDLGDLVKLAGVQGTVEHMSLRMTVLRDDTGALHSIPNSEIKIVSNMTRDWAQVALHVSVDYAESSDRVIELLKEVGADLQDDPEYGKDIVGKPEVPGIERVSGSEVDYLMIVKCRPGRQHAVRRELRRRIKASLERNGIKAGAPNRMYVMEAPPSAG